jgi:LysR family transcriptional regulator, hca operon transcriptional activator
MSSPAWLSGTMSLVASTGGVTLFPLSVQNLLTPNVVARPLEGKAPTIDLMLGYNKTNSSPLLKQFLSRADELVEGVRKQTILRYVEAR